MDNLANFGIKSDEPRRRGKKRRGRKPFVIEARVPRRVTAGLASTLGLHNWWVSNRYLTRARRDRAYAVLVKKDAGTLWALEYKTRDD